MVGAATSSPVNGETTLGSFAPMPRPLSRTQFDWTRFIAPPAPANAIAPSSVAIGIASIAVGDLVDLDEALRPRAVYPSLPSRATIAYRMNSTISATMKNWIFSTVR